MSTALFVRRAKILAPPLTPRSGKPKGWAFCLPWRISTFLKLIDLIERIRSVHMLDTSLRTAARTRLAVTSGMHNTCLARE